MKEGDLVREIFIITTNTIIMTMKELVSNCWTEIDIVTIK